MQIRLAKKSDKNEFLELALERDAGLNSSSHYYPPFRKIIGNISYWNHKFADLVASRSLLLAFVDGKPAGFLYFTAAFIDYPAAYVELVFVSKSVRKLGVAKKLFDSVEKIVAKLGHAKIFSSTNPDNAISLKMHRKLGYKKCGLIDGIETPTSREIFLSKSLKIKSD